MPESLDDFLVSYIGLHMRTSYQGQPDLTIVLSTHTGTKSNMNERAATRPHDHSIEWRTPRSRFLPTHLSARVCATASHDEGKFMFYNSEFGVHAGKLWRMGLEPVGAMGSAGMGFI